MTTSFLKNPKFVANRLKHFTHNDRIICDPGRRVLVTGDGHIHIMPQMPITVDFDELSL